MAYSYDIHTSKKDKRSTICLFSTHSISSIVNLFISTFLVAQLYSYTDNIYSYIINVCAFEGITYIFFGLFMVPLSYLLEKTNRVWFYRLALVLRAGIIVLAIFLNSNVTRILYISAICNGVSYAFYYSSYNTLKQEMVSRKSMHSYSVFIHCAELVVKILIPILLGTLIDVSTFSKVAICLAVLCIIQIGLSFGVHSKKPDHSNFDLKKYFQKLKTQPDTYKKIKMLYWGAFIYGFTSIVSTILNICVIIQFGSNFSLGAMSSLFSLVSMITILFFNKFTTKGRRSKIYILTAILPFLCAIVFALYPTVWTLILYNVGTAISAIIYKTVYDIYRNGILKEAGLYSEITEHQSIVEMLMSSSRVLSYLFLILLSLFRSFVIFNVFLCVSVLSYSAILIFLYIYEKKYPAIVNSDSQDEQQNQELNSNLSNNTDTDKS